MAFPTKEELTSFSSFTRQWSHDIFLSFRGEDTRYGFTGHLYTALCNYGLNTFFDNNLERGEEISKELLKTIEMSMISIVVLSENYASSTWCLDELVKILECRNTGRIRKVYPIFYKVTPSEVRKNEGNFGIALDDHEKKFKDDMEKVKRWRETLTEVANLSGHEYKNGEIVESKSEKLENHSRIWYHEDAYELLTKNMGRAFETLTNINLNGCKFITKLPSLLCAPKLKNLDMSDCENLIEIHGSVGDLDKLETWKLDGCSKLEILPSSLMLRSLKRFDLSYCGRLEKFPAICAPNLKHLGMSDCENLIEIHGSVGDLDKLETWNLRRCSKLEILPSRLMLRSLAYFNLSYCGRLEKFPAICAPNLDFLELRYCKNLIEVHESVGDLHKLIGWNLESCIKLEILPSRLQLRSLESLNLTNCGRLEKFPDIHPEMKCLKNLLMTNSSIREWPSSFTHLTKGLRSLQLSNNENLWNFLYSCNKLQQLKEIDIPTANSFDGFSGYGFLSLTFLWLNSWDGDITELDFQYFPLLRYLYIYDSNIISIPQSISGLARLRTIEISNCKQLREIPTLPQSVRRVFVSKCPSVDPQSFSRLLIQFGGARSNISMDPFHDSESESESEDEGEYKYEISYFLRLPVIEIPKYLKFNHQTFGNSVSFWVGKKFSKLAICIAFQTGEAHMYNDFYVEISINGCEVPGSVFYKNWTEEELWLWSISLEQLNKRKLPEQSHIEVEVICKIRDHTDLIKWLGVNVECTCYPQNSDVTCLPLPCAMNGCGSSSIPNDTEFPPLLPVSSTSYASDSDHRAL